MVECSANSNGRELYLSASVFGGVQPVAGRALGAGGIIAALGGTARNTGFAWDFTSTKGVLSKSSGTGLTPDVAGACALGDSAVGRWSATLHQ